MSRTIQYLHRCLKTIDPLFATKESFVRVSKLLQNLQFSITDNPKCPQNGLQYKNLKRFLRVNISLISILPQINQLYALFCQNLINWYYLSPQFNANIIIKNLYKRSDIAVNRLSLTHFAFFLVNPPSGQLTYFLNDPRKK